MSKHLGPVSPVGTLLHAEVRMDEGTSSQQMIRASLSLSQTQMKEQLTHDQLGGYTRSHAMEDVLAHWLSSCHRPPTPKITG